MGIIHKKPGIDIVTVSPTEVGGLITVFDEGTGYSDLEVDREFRSQVRFAEYLNNARQGVFDPVEFSNSGVEPGYCDALRRAEYMWLNAQRLGLEIEVPYNIRVFPGLIFPELLSIPVNVGTEICPLKADISFLSPCYIKDTSGTIYAFSFLPFSSTYKALYFEYLQHLAIVLKERSDSDLYFDSSLISAFVESYIDRIHLLHLHPAVSERKFLLRTPSIVGRLLPQLAEYTKYRLSLYQNLGIDY